MGKPSSPEPQTEKAVATPRQRARRMPAEERRQQILNCAIEVFSETGLINAKHTDVAFKADVSIPTVFHYFPTLEALQEAVLKELHTFFVESLIKPQQQRSDLPAYERIEQILLAFEKIIDDKRPYVTVWLEWSGFTRGFTWELYMEFYREATSELRKMILDGRHDGSISATINATDASRVVMGMAHTVAHLRFSQSSARVVRKTVHSLVMSYLASA